MVAAIRAKSQIPLVLMAYYNSIHAYGPDRFCQEATAAGVDGLIVPDMPPDEAGPLKGTGLRFRVPFDFFTRADQHGATPGIRGAGVQGLSSTTFP